MIISDYDVVVLYPFSYKVLHTFLLQSMYFTMLSLFIYETLVICVTISHSKILNLESFLESVKCTCIDSIMEHACNSMRVDVQ